MTKNDIKICSNCVMDTTDELIKFDENGVCDHCNNFYNNILPNWNPDEKGAKELAEIVNKIKKEGQGKTYDCIIGLSGGVDSSYLLYYAVEVLKLRPYVYAVDTGWTLNVAIENIEKLVKGLGLDLYTDIINWQEMKDLQLAYFKANVPYQDTPQDHVIFASLYNHAVKNNIKYVLTGGNYSTECIREPNEWVFYANDLRLMKDIHKKFGKKKLTSLPTCSMFKARLYYRYFKGMKVIKPLDLIPYKKEDALQLLEKKFGYERYANKHFESIFTRFFEGYWIVKKFGYDKRKAHFSSLILTGQMTREESLEKLKEPPYDENLAMQDMEYIAKKLGLSREEFIKLMEEPNKTYRDYKSTHSLIEKAIKLAQFVGLEKRQFR